MQKSLFREFSLMLVGGFVRPNSRLIVMPSQCFLGLFGSEQSAVDTTAPRTPPPLTTPCRSQCPASISSRFGALTFNSNSGQLKSDRRALLSEGCGVFLPFDQKDTFPAKSSCELPSITAEKCLAYNGPFILAYLPVYDALSPSPPAMFRFSNVDSSKFTAQYFKKRT
ncbi:hypothetical protein MHYP_G00273750 [Metynnis hypsauchen]